MKAKSILAGLIFECPQGTPLEECQLRGMRSLPAIERVRWLHSLPDEDIQHLVDRHKLCLQNRLS